MDARLALCGAVLSKTLYSRPRRNRVCLPENENHFAYLEDLDVGYRAQIFGYRNYYEPGAMVIHYGSASSGPQYNAWKTEISAENNVYVVFKNMPFLQRLFNFPFLFVGYLVKFLFFSRKKLGKIYVKGLWKGLKKKFFRAGPC